MCKYYIDSQWDYSNIDILILHYGFAVFLSQASGFNKISKISKIFIEIERLSMP